MLEIASQMIICLLLAALIGVIIGYIIGKNTCPDDSIENVETIAVQDEESVIVATSTTGTAPIVLSGPRNGKKDNLTRIKGIGLKIDAILNSIGIYHFDQIANWTDDNIAWADNSLGMPGRAKRENWIEQAKALSLGEETEFSKRVDAGKVSSSKKV